MTDKTAAKLLKQHEYSLQAPSKSVEGTQRFVGEGEELDVLLEPFGHARCTTTR
jgi:hypothetical protein